ncbi:T9SS type A sorting domain-containing protein [bacterium]|nr:T9SS type A sorting domain-containing protein [bacterium]
MKNIFFIFAAVFFLLAIGGNAQADWLGLMDSGTPIDLPNADAEAMDIAFDQNNNGICVTTQQTTAFYNLLVNRQSYGSDTWSNNDTPVDIITGVIGSTKYPDLDIRASGIGMCVYSKRNNTTGYERIFGGFYNSNFTIVNNSIPLDPIIFSEYDATQPTVAVVNDNLIILNYLKSDAGGVRVVATKWENNTATYWTASGWNTTGSALAVDGKEGANSSRPHLATSDLGEVFGVFVKQGALNKICSSKYSNGQWYIWSVGGWNIMGSTINSEAISSNNSSHNTANPRLAPLSNGRMICVYELIEKATGNSRINYSIYNGQQWLPGVNTQHVDVAGNTVLAASPDIAVSPQGKVICVYAKGNTANSTQHVYAVEWDGANWLPMNNNQWIDAQGNSITVITPKIEFDQLGNAICVFQQYLESEDKTRTYANYFQGPPFVSSITPDNGRNNDWVTITVAGYNFAGGSTTAQRISARLTRAGQPAIFGENIQVASPTLNFFTASQFTVEFNLDGAQVGDWDLEVRNPDGQNFTLPSLFGITWPDLSQANVYPNPIRPGSGGSQAARNLRFFDLTSAVTIRIFTLKGELIQTLTKDDRQLYLDWDLRNQTGRTVAPGVYLYRIESSEGSIIKGKFMVIR